MRPIRDRVNQALVKLDGLFTRIYAEDRRGGRPSIAPEKLLRQVKVRGLAKVDQCFVLAMTCYNLVRMRTVGFLRQESAQNAGIA